MVHKLAHLFAWVLKLHLIILVFDVWFACCLIKVLLDDVL
jgi:hypothetical protein